MMARKSPVKTAIVDTVDRASFPSSESARRTVMMMTDLVDDRSSEQRLESGVEGASMSGSDMLAERVVGDSIERKRV
jgi:hypothetical protein